MALGITASLASPCLGAPEAPRKIASVEGITEYRLANGLQVLLFPDPSRPSVTVNLTVFAGSRHEGYGETGMAHLLEHMLFKGTPEHPDIPRVLKERGARFNGTTSYDRTNYFETLTASDENLEFAIRLEGDRLVNSFVRGADLATEMTVVRNEFERGENSPMNILEQRMMAVAYEWHNYGKTTIGNRSDIERVPIERLQAFYRKHYRPANALLVVAGQFDGTRALDLIAKYFGPLTNPDTKIEAPYTEEPAQDGERVVILRRVGDVGVVGALYHVPAGAHPEFAAVQILNRILTSAPSGRLYKALVETGKASSVNGSDYSLHDPGSLVFMAQVPKGKSIEEVRDTMLSVLERTGDGPVTSEEVERARQQLLKQRDLAGANTSRLAIQLSEWAAQGDWRLYFLDRDRIEQVTPEQVQAVARQYLRPSNRTVGLYIPSEKAERTTVPATPDLAAMVKGYKGRDTGSAGESFDVTPARIEARVQRPGTLEGVKVALLPKKTRNEMVHIDLDLHYGNAENLKGLVVAAEFLPPLLTRQTKQLSRQQLQDALDRNRAQLSARGGPGEIGVSIETRRASLPAVLDLLRQVLREPALPAAEFEILKNQQLSRLERSRTEPSVLAGIRLARLLASYPTDDVRYTPTIDEEIERVKAARLDQVKTLYDQYLGAGRGELAVVGDFEPSEILPLLARALEGWKAEKPYARIERPYQGGHGPAHETIVTPDKANATYSAGLTLPLRDDHPDYAALVMGNSILGGGFSSRLTDRLRHRGGLSYSAGSRFAASALDTSARLSIFAICNPDNMPKVETGVAEELARWVKDGVTTEELEQARSGFLQQQKIARSSDRALAGMLAQQLYEGRTMKYEEELEDRVRQLTPESIAAAVRKHIDPARLSSVAAGDLESSKASSP
jgi:zinc protease